MDHIHIKDQIRQGDVLLDPIAEIPAEAKIIAESDIVLAYGEATGHAHRLKGRAVLMEHEGRRYLLVDGEPTLLVHEEHGTTVVKPRVYEVIAQREADLSGQWRQVID